MEFVLGHMLILWQMNISDLVFCCLFIRKTILNYFNECVDCVFYYVKQGES